MSAARHGDARAARKLFERHVDVVMSYCVLSSAYDRETAKDLTQETFLRAFRALSTLKDGDAFRGWLLSITRNVCRTQASRRADWFRLLDEVAQESRLMNEALSAQCRLRLNVQDILASLPDSPGKRMAILKYTDPEHTTREIAELLEVPHGTVTVGLMRIRAVIKKQMRAALEEENKVAG